MVRHVAAVLLACVLGCGAYPAQTAVSRRSMLRTAAGLAAATAAAPRAGAEAVPTSLYLDPDSQFGVELPTRFFRVQKPRIRDDNPFAASQSITLLTAGDLAKAEIVSIERYPASLLLTNAGIMATGDLSTWPTIATDAGAAALVVQRRDAELIAKGGKTQTSQVVDGSLSRSGNELSFEVLAEVPVQRPELLQEQSGLSRLRRRSVVKCVLKGTDVYQIWGSALETDWNDGEEVSLRAAATSFRLL